MGKSVGFNREDSEILLILWLRFKMKKNRGNKNDVALAAKLEDVVFSEPLLWPTAGSLSIVSCL